MGKCRFYEVCPIYTGILQDQEMSAKAFKTQFCEADFDSCKRYAVRIRGYLVPKKLLPSSRMSVDEIVEKYKCPKG